MEELDAMVQNAYQGNSSFVVDLIEKYEFAALEHSGGPVMVSTLTCQCGSILLRPNRLQAALLARNFLQMRNAIIAAGNHGWRR
eukprot:758184-Hanusia_phi.AAC.6